MSKHLVILFAIFMIIGTPYIVFADHGENDFVLYGFALDKDLEQNMVMAKNKGFEIKTFETPDNEKVVNLIVNIAKSKNIDIDIEKLSEKEFYDYTNTQLYYNLQVGGSLVDTLSNEFKIDFIPIIFNIKNKAFILSLFFKGQQNKFYPYSFLVEPSGDYINAAMEVVKSRAEREEKSGMSTVLIKGDLVCEIAGSPVGFIFYSSSLIEGLKDKVNSYYQKKNEEKEQRAKDKLHQLQEGM